MLTGSKGKDWMMWHVQEPFVTFTLVFVSAINLIKHLYFLCRWQIQLSAWSNFNWVYSQNVGIKQTSDSDRGTLVSLHSGDWMNAVITWHAHNHNESEIWLCCEISVLTILRFTAFKCQTKFGSTYIQLNFSSQLVSDCYKRVATWQQHNVRVLSGDHPKETREEILVGLRSV